MEQNHDQRETAQTVDYQERQSAQNLFNSQIKKMQSSDFQQKKNLSSKKKYSYFFDNLSTTQVLKRFKFLIYKEKNVIPLQIANGFKDLGLLQKKQKIIFYFPQAKSCINSLNEQIIEKIIDQIIQTTKIQKIDSKPKPQIQNMNKDEIIKICLDFLPLMKNQIQTMSYGELQKLYLEVLSQKRRKKNKLRCQFKDRHPFQIKIQNKNTLQPKINIEKLLNNIKQQQPTLCKVIQDVEEKLIAKYKELQKTLIQMEKMYRQKRKDQFQQNQLKTIRNNNPNYFQQINFQNEFFKTVDQTNQQQLIISYHHVEKRTYQEMNASNAEKDKDGYVIYAHQQDCNCQKKPKATKRFISQNSKINDK